MKEGGNVETDHRYYFSINVGNGNMEPIQLPLRTKIGILNEYFENHGIDHFGNIFNLETKEISEIDIKNTNEKIFGE